ncbi:TRI39 ligase, partial [Polyodon spathula]|nr:TRI39 ligase [Polyodon spathula]
SLLSFTQNSVSAGEAVEQDLAELVKEWKRGKLSNILPIMEFIMWALIKLRQSSGLKELNLFSLEQRRLCGDLIQAFKILKGIDSVDPRDFFSLKKETRTRAHPRLTLSAEGKRVRSEATMQDLPDNPERFDYRRCVLGREGFTSGRRYWQVQGYWTVDWWSRGEFAALTDPKTPLHRSLKPQKLGVYLDYEEGQLSFYNVKSRSQIYTFTDMEFNPNEKLYPLFCTGNRNTDLVLESPDPDPVSAAD